MSVIKSNTPLSAWRGNMSLHSSFFNTRPVEELKDLAWPMTVHAYAPGDTPVHIDIKEYGTYIVGSRYRSAQLVGKTFVKAIERGQATLGKMRSASHVTETTLLVADLDGITEDQFDSIGTRLNRLDLTNLKYTTHSHGRPDKPGVRCRIVMPVDAPLDAPNYKRALQGAQILLFDRLADENAFSLAQAHGVWMASKERAQSAFKLRHDGGVLAAQALINAAPTQTKELNTTQHANDELSLFDNVRVKAALEWIDVSEYVDWFDVAMWLKAAWNDSAKPLWLDLSVSGKYDPHEFWEALVPRMPPGAGAGCLFKAAKDSAIKVASRCAYAGEWSKEGRRAIQYLKYYHRNAYSNLFFEAG